MSTDQKLYRVTDAMGDLLMITPLPALLLAFDLTDAEVAQLHPARMTTGEKIRIYAQGRCAGFWYVHPSIDIEPANGGREAPESFLGDFSSGAVRPSLGSSGGGARQPGAESMTEARRREEKEARRQVEAEREKQAATINEFTGAVRSALSHPRFVGSSTPAQAALYMINAAISHAVGLIATAALATPAADLSAPDKYRIVNETAELAWRGAVDGKVFAPIKGQLESQDTRGPGRAAPKGANKGKPEDRGKADGAEAPMVDRVAGSEQGGEGKAPPEDTKEQAAPAEAQKEPGAQA